MERGEGFAMGQQLYRHTSPDLHQRLGLLSYTYIPGELGSLERFDLRIRLQGQMEKVVDLVRVRDEHVRHNESYSGISLVLEECQNN